MDYTENQFVHQHKSNVVVKYNVAAFLSCASGSARWFSQLKGRGFRFPVNAKALRGGSASLLPQVRGCGPPGAGRVGRDYAAAQQETRSHRNSLQSCSREDVKKLLQKCSRFAVLPSLSPPPPLMKKRRFNQEAHLVDVCPLCEVKTVHLFFKSLPLSNVVSSSNILIAPRLVV